MPISNGSKIWPKILICKKCKRPVEEGSFGRAKLDAYLYECPSCETSVTAEQTEWVREPYE